MRRLKPLNVDSAEVYDACISEIDDSELAERFIRGRAEIITAFQKYEFFGGTHQLFMLAASPWGNDTQEVLAGLTKKEFVELYSRQMVGREKPGRRYYDSLMMLAPLGKCPFCGFGQVSTLDHFLSKARYPAFSVLSTNLVPACADCNKGKGSSLVTQYTQSLHPYFEEKIVETDTWLFAEVFSSTPVTVRYFVQPPDSWPADLVKRVANYFHYFDLARRFAIEAATELSGLGDLLEELRSPDLRHAHLSTVARIERTNRKNSWKAALYEALAENGWYVNGGYHNLVR
ncbi:hypothetical protein ABC383_22890 [Noviherbaspirillum sp. 1P10PC]|uniref:HNH endonuclease n=1 Tax=Noviherbaspirillum sp. 1P10PC TaxID=3132292 RepID=UPI0039A279AE